MSVAIQDLSNEVSRSEWPARNLWRNRFISSLLLGLAIVTCRRIDFTTSSLSESQDSSELNRSASAQIHDQSIDQDSGGYAVSIHPIEDGFW